MSGTKEQIMRVVHEHDGKHDKEDYSREVMITGMNLSVAMRSNVENENLEYLSHLGLSILSELKRLENTNEYKICIWNNRADAVRNYII